MTDDKLKHCIEAGGAPLLHEEVVYHLWLLDEAEKRGFAKGIAAAVDKLLSLCHCDESFNGRELFDPGCDVHDDAEVLRALRYEEKP